MNPSVLADIEAERHRQDAKWGEQHHPPAMWLTILTEEVGEVAQEVIRCAFEHGEPDDLKTEMIHVAAVAVQWLEAIEREKAIHAH